MKILVLGGKVFLYRYIFSIRIAKENDCFGYSRGSN